MNKKITVSTVMLLSAFTLASCGVGTAKPIDLLPKEKQEKVVSKISDMTLENKKPSEIEKVVDQNISRMNKENASKAVYFLDYSIDSKQGDVIEDLSVFGDKLKDSDTKKVDYNKPKTYKYIEDKTVKGFLDELAEQHLMIRENKGSYMVVKKEGVLLSKYEKYLNEPVMNLLMAQKKLSNTPSGAKGMEYKLEILLGGETSKKTWKGTPYENNWLSFLSYVYQDFFTPEDGETFSEKEKAEYFRLQNEYSNSAFGDDMVDFIGVTESSNGKFDEKTVEFIHNKIEKNYPVTNETPEGLIQ